MLLPPGEPHPPLVEFKLVPKVDKRGKHVGWMVSEEGFHWRIGPAVAITAVVSGTIALLQGLGVLDLGRVLPTSLLSDAGRKEKWTKPSDPVDDDSGEGITIDSLATRKVGAVKPEEGGYMLKLNEGGTGIASAVTVVNTTGRDLWVHRVAKNRGVDGVLRLSKDEVKPLPKDAEHEFTSGGTGEVKLRLRASP